jgi:CRP-like cAMP-binding protein
LAAVSELLVFPAGTVIVRQGDLATAFFVITRGAVEVIRDQPPLAEFLAASLHPGHFFGEMALLKEGERTATIRTSEDTECLVLEKHAFDREMYKDPNAAAVLATRMARRIHQFRAPA